MSAARDLSDPVLLRAYVLARAGARDAPTPEMRIWYRLELLRLAAELGIT